MSVAPDAVLNFDAAVLPDVAYRSLEERDIGSINALYFREYGPAYPYPLTEVRRDDGVRLVAEADGEVIAYAQAAPYDRYPRVFEFGRLIVRADWRGRHVAKRLTELRLRGVREIGGAMATSENVCYRQDCASQRNLVNHGFVLCGIQPCKYPRLHEDLLGEQPETVLVAAMVLRRDEAQGFGRRRVFLPNGLPNILRTFLPKYVYERGFGALVAGDMPSHVEHEANEVDGSIGSRFVDIPINWPEAEEIVLAYIHAGYRFSAILPGFGMTEAGAVYDLVRLFRPPDIRINYDFVHVVDQIRPLHAFMRREYEPADR